MDYSTSTYVRPEPPEWTLALDEGGPYIADNYSDVLPDDADEWKPSCRDMWQAGLALIDFNAWVRLLPRHPRRCPRLAADKRPRNGPHGSGWSGEL